MAIRRIIKFTHGRSANLGLAQAGHTSRGQYFAIFKPLARVENVLESPACAKPYSVASNAGQYLK